MKKWLTALLISSLLIIFSVYFFIPDKLNFSKIQTISCGKNQVSRILLDKSKWSKWWPGQGPESALDSNQSFFYNGLLYRIADLFTDKIGVLVIDDKDTINTAISILPLNNDSVTIQWVGSLTTSINPIQKVMKYQKAILIKKNMTAIVQTLQAFLEKSSNIYGFPIEEIIAKDSTLIVTRYITRSYPETKEIYTLIDSIKHYMIKQGALQTNHPMLSVSKINDSLFHTMIAIPVNKVVEGNGRFFFQRFVPYKTITGTVRGGVNTIELAFKQMEVFVDDHQRTPMALPFQLLVTDRIMEADSLKWTTIICQPVS